MRFGDFKITQKAESTYDDLDSSVYLRLAFLGSISSPGTKTEKTSALRDSPAPDCSAERTAASGPTESEHRSTSVQALWVQMRSKDRNIRSKKGFLVIYLITNAKEERRNDLRWLKWTESDVLDSAAASLKWVWGESWGALHLHLINTQTSCSQIKGTFPCKRDCAIYTWLLHYSKGTDYGRAWYLTLSLKLKLWFWQEARYESRALLRSCAHGDQDQIWIHFKWTFLRLGLPLSYKPI